MRSSNKPRSRNKNHNSNRRGNTTNVLNWVFDSAGPDGRVRGTPQQIIEKYQSLSHDATLAGDRVTAENLLQHSEHYSRLLTDAQREINERREAQDAQRQQQQQNQNQQQNAAQQPQQPQQNTQPKAENPAVIEGDTQPDIAGNADDLFPGQANKPNLVETPESKVAPAPEKPKKPKRVRQPAMKKADPVQSEAEKPAKTPKPVAEKPAKAPKPDTAAE